MTEFQLESGDTGQALLPVPVSAIAERAKQADASRSEVEKVKGEGAPSLHGLTESECRYALAWLSGFDPELYARALRRAKGDLS